MEKIGILGGTFNPVHLGHLMIAENAYEQFGLDRVWILPTGNSPHKNDREILDGESRCRMVELAIEGNPHFQLSRMEVDSEETSYTYRTLQRCRELYPDTEFYFIMGGDSIAYFEHWKKPEIICSLAHVIVAARDQVQAEALKEITDRLSRLYETEISIITCPVFRISSHEIREKAALGKSIRYLVPEEVRCFIEANHIYEDKG